MVRIVVQLHGRDFAISRTIRVDRHEATSTGISGGPNAADDAEEVPHRPNIYVTDVSRGDSVAPDEHRKRIVVQVHGRDFALG